MSKPTRALSLTLSLTAACTVAASCTGTATFTLIAGDEPVDVEITQGDKVVAKASGLKNGGTIEVPKGDVSIATKSALGQRSVNAHIDSGVDRVFPAPGVCAVVFDLTDGYLEKKKEAWEGSLPTVKGLSLDGKPVEAGAVHRAFSIEALPNEVSAGASSTVILVERVSCDADGRALTADMLKRLAKRFPR